VRETRVPQASIFEEYSKHKVGVQLKKLSSVLDDHPEILRVIKKDLVNQSLRPVGRSGMTVENIFRCLLLKQQLGVSYEQLAFHLSDSVSYRTFVRLPGHLMPQKSSLQSTIRSIKPETLERVHHILSRDWLEKGTLSLEKLRIDSTVVASNIAPPSDSQLLNDSVRVLSRALAKSREETGLKIRFTDKRKASKSLAFQIFNAKNATKEALYPRLLQVVKVVLKQVERALTQVREKGICSASMQKWISKVTHYKDLTLQIVDQTVRRVIDKESVPSCEKIVSLFEEHTDIIVKGFRDVHYGHKINLSTEKNGLITCLKIENGNPADSVRFMSILSAHQNDLGCLPKSVVSDGCYASQDNLFQARALGVQQIVFNKRAGLSFHAMGVKRKTFDRLRCFRAGIEGNISELKRAFGMGKAKWKGHDGFKAFVWSSVISYNLVRVARMQSG